ncbi:MAG: PorT family protein [Bacteroidetes bacterium]|nr:PorT family protein [Bacteroidota bacterium]
MKKIVVVGIFLFFLFQNTNAQLDIRFGFQVSPTFSWMSTNVTRINPSGTNLGLRLGVMGEYYFQENYAITSGIGFSFNQGGTLLYDFGGNYWVNTEFNKTIYYPLPDDVKLKHNIQYVEIPMGLKMRTREFGYLRYYIEPQLIWGFKTQARGDITGPNIENLEKLNIKKDVNGLNASWGIGGGVEYSISDETALIGGIFFHKGFFDVTDDGGTYDNPNIGGNVKEDSKGTISSITLRIGILF